MSTKAETKPSRLDMVKLIVALAIVVAGLAAFYYYGETSLFVRVLGLLAALAVAGAVAWQTEQGREVVAFLKDVQIEVRKVVWPTRQETIQTTLVVVLMVVIAAVFLWVLDVSLGWLVRQLTGQV